MYVTLQVFYLAIGTALVLAGLVVRSILVFAMANSDYDRFSFLETWVMVSPVLFAGIFLLWLGMMT
jgi:hypothetical protein